jgi:hypothetical protein
MRMNDGLMSTSASPVRMNGLRDTQRVTSLVSRNDAFMLVNDAFVRTNDAFVRMSASFVLTKDVMTVVAQGTAISFLSNKKPRRWARLFCFCSLFLEYQVWL